MPQRLRLPVATATLAAALLAGCGARTRDGGDPRDLATRPTTGQAQAGSAFTDPDTGVSLRPPAGWIRVPSLDYVLAIAPPAGGPPAISLDIPKLPPHVPGWIPIGMVRNGYVDDVAKAHKGAKSVDLDPPKIAGANTRLVRSEWAADGTGFTELALLVVRGDRVYIVRLTGRSADHATDRAAFDAVVGSLSWAKVSRETKHSLRAVVRNLYHARPSGRTQPQPLAGVSGSRTGFVAGPWSGPCDRPQVETPPSCE